MQYHAIKHDAVFLILDTEVDDMGRYDKIDAEQVARQRRADIVARKPLAPRHTCNYCGHSVAPGALWCSSSCAQMHADERDKVLMSSPVSNPAILQEPAE